MDIHILHQISLEFDVESLKFGTPCIMVDYGVKILQNHPIQAKFLYIENTGNS